MTPRSSLVFRTANGLAVAICLLWFFFSPSFEPVVTGLVLAAGFFVPLQNTPEKEGLSHSGGTDSSSRPESDAQSQGAGVEVVTGMSNQPTPALACLEHLRLENIQAPWADIPAIFSAARFMTDCANVRRGWNVAEVRQGEEGSIPALLDRFVEQYMEVSQKFSLEHHYLALVAFGGSAGENEELASRIEMVCNASKNQRGIKVLIGFMAVNRFVDRVLTSA